MKIKFDKKKNMISVRKDGKDVDTKGKEDEIAKLDDVDIGVIVENIGKLVGPDVPVNASGANRLLKKARDGNKKGKFVNAVAKAGIVGKDIVFAIGSDKEEEKVVVLKDFEKARTNSKNSEIVNAHEALGNDKNGALIVKIAENILVGEGGEVSKDDEALNKKGDKAPIVVLAHGEKSESKGKVYATKYAEKTPQEMFEFLTKTKKLPKNYAGTLYLNGCFTAAGKTDENYAKKVYKLFEKAGYKYMKVEGNLGETRTLEDGNESVFDAQEQKRLKAELDETEKTMLKFKANYDALKKVMEKMAEKGKVVSREYKSAKDYWDSPFFANLTLAMDKVNEHNIAFSALKKKIRDELKPKLSGHKYHYDIKNLKGSFGPAEIQNDSRFKKLFN